jgi:hypothetical protein
MPKNTPKRTRGQPRNPAVDELVKAGGYTRRGARKMIAEAKSTGESVQDLAGARLRKVKLEGDKLEYSLEVLRGKHIPKEKVDEEGIALGMAVKAQLLSWIGAMPGRLEGLTAAAMVPIFEDEIARILKTLEREC